MTPAGVVRASGKWLPGPLPASGSLDDSRLPALPLLLRGPNSPTRSSPGPQPPRITMTQTGYALAGRRRPSLPCRFPLQLARRHFKPARDVEEGSSRGRGVQSVSRGFGSLEPNPTVPTCHCARSLCRPENRDKLREIDPKQGQTAHIGRSPPPDSPRTSRDQASRELCGGTSGNFCDVALAVGPEPLGRRDDPSAATASSPPKIGTATPRVSAWNSRSSTAKPRARLRASSRRSQSGPVNVRSVNARTGCSSTASRHESRQASNALPLAVQ
jgi:hypothetical protein